MKIGHEDVVNTADHRWPSAVHYAIAMRKTVIESPRQPMKPPGMSVEKRLRGVFPISSTARSHPSRSSPAMSKPSAAASTSSLISATALSGSPSPTPLSQPRNRRPTPSHAGRVASLGSHGLIQTPVDRLFLVVEAAGVAAEQDFDGVAGALGDFGR